MPTHYIIHTKVRQVGERHRIVSVSKDGIEQKEKLGWFVCFENSWESNFIGNEKPELEVGQEVEIVIRPRKM